MSKTYYSKSLFAAIGLFAIIWLTGCKKENTAPVSPNTTATTTSVTPNKPAPTSPYFLTGNLAGESINALGTALYFTETTPSTSTGGCEGGGVGPNGNGSSGSPDDNTTKISGGKWTTTDLGGITITTAIVEMKRLAVRVYVAPISFNHYNLVAPGIYGYTNSGVSGASISILDSRGTVWTTNGDQTGSSFEIISRSDSTATSIQFGGTFSAKMYDKNGNVKQITNGAFSALAGL